MKGADVLRQETLDWAADLLRRNGCVVLTREEAEAMEQAFLTGGGRLHGELLSIPQALALLSPNEAGDE